MKLNTLIAMTVLSAATTMMATTAHAEDQWQKNHPRRTEVNHRLDKENNRINKDEKNGEITKRQADQLHREDHHIRNEERNMARHDNGHITKGEQEKLNHQENRVNNQLKNDIQKDKTN